MIMYSTLPVMLVGAFHALTPVSQELLSASSRKPYYSNSSDAREAVTPGATDKLQRSLADASLCLRRRDTQHYASGIRHVYGRPE